MNEKSEGGREREGERVEKVEYERETLFDFACLRERGMFMTFFGVYFVRGNNSDEEPIFPSPRRCGVVRESAARERERERERQQESFFLSFLIFAVCGETKNVFFLSPPFVILFGGAAVKQ